MPNTFIRRIIACSVIVFSFINPPALGLQAASVPLVASGQALSFEQYLLELKQEASAKRISQVTLDDAFAQIKRFKKLNTAKALQTYQSLETYLSANIPDWKVNTARVLFNKHQAELNQIADKFNVQPRFLVALWGLVSNFGDASGDYSVLSVTASLAFTAREAGKDDSHYKQELWAALTLMDNESLSFDALKSNERGLMGQSQLLPSEFLAYGQDGDSDGKKDIWHNSTDAFASMANLLKQQGWNGADTWGRQVQTPSTLKANLVGLNQSHTLAKWQQLGVRRFDNTDLPQREDINASLIMPDGVKGRKYLVYANYRALKRWYDVKVAENGDYFGISVVQLSERIKTPQ